ncbi:hypothetical protein BO70DRAFT_425522 [Aspergillus heteromorphus CBS 117.55]|uniref:Cupredoxin n=1 Tax=Aspergillus heteromorphus CBS 117.55 TaxID=1448321 RepID=A0A317X3W8_9EURO|nr:uncharacterized protein BO70DRAFT_425522 [Aspergillus heteromorphus CBS 117.55]PWY92871.1 hypothetical protein BO70DRAFT_425522 [Aspergillus heteromorphus CBS 117.55]
MKMVFLPQLLVWTTILSSAAAQSTTYASAITPTSGGAATHTIKVGSKEYPHGYSPRNITAAVGDVVVFEFYPTNHSVVKADYMAPCVPADGAFFYSGIFDSYNEKNGQLVGPPPTWSLVINDTEPTFFYCTATDSCIDNGMVGAINPNETMTWQAQFNKAKIYPYMLVPGQSPPAEGSVPGAPTTSTSSTSTSTSTGSSTSTSSPSASNSKPTLSTGAIIGIALGSVAFLALLGALFFLLGRNRVYSQWEGEDGEVGGAFGSGGGGAAGGGGQRKSVLDGSGSGSGSGSTGPQRQMQMQMQGQGQGIGTGAIGTSTPGSGTGTTTATGTSTGTTTTLVSQGQSVREYGSSVGLGVGFGGQTPGQNQNQNQSQDQGRGLGLWRWDGTGYQFQGPQGQAPGQIYQGPGLAQGHMMYEAMARGPSELEGTSRM